MKAVVLVPRRDGFEDRDRLWRWCKDWWQDNLPELPIFEGHHNDGPFNRSAAVNLAATLAGDWDVAVIIDSDIILDPDNVRKGIELAAETGRITLPFKVRRDLDQRGSQRVMAGYRGNWQPFVRHVYLDTCSSCVIVSRALWDAVGGFDEGFVGWGFEDNAWAAACETFSGQELLRLDGEVWHLWHRTAPEGKRGSPTFNRNKMRAARYLDARGDREATLAIRDRPQPLTVATIPRILHRVVPEHTTDEVERWWAQWAEMLPGWELKTHRDPLDPAEWPLSSPHWPKVKAGAQLADLVRLEALHRWGGVYVDQDVEPYRSLEPLLGLQAFAAWEDATTVPNAVMGASPGHPAIRECLHLAIQRMDTGIWAAGPGVTTEILPGRPDVLLLPPGSFYPYHYRAKHLRSRDHAAEQPWAFAAHHWFGSWLPEKNERAEPAA